MDDPARVQELEYEIVELEKRLQSLHRSELVKVSTEEETERCFDDDVACECDFPDIGTKDQRLETATYGHAAAETKQPSGKDCQTQTSYRDLFPQREFSIDEHEAMNRPNRQLLRTASEIAGVHLPNYVIHKAKK